MTPETLLHTLFFASFVCLPIAWVCSAILVFLLRRRHETIWESLDSPTVLPSRWHLQKGQFGHLTSGIKTARYLFGMKWLELDDPLFEGACWIWWIVHIGYLIVFVVLIVLMIGVENELF